MSECFQGLISLCVLSRQLVVYRSDIAVVATRIVSTCFRELGIVEGTSGNPPALAQLLGPGESPARTVQATVAEVKPEARSSRRGRTVDEGKPVRQARKRRITSSDEEDEEDEEEAAESQSDSDSQEESDGGDESSESDRLKMRHRGRSKAPVRQRPQRLTRSKRK